MHFICLHKIKLRAIRERRKEDGEKEKTNRWRACMMNIVYTQDLPPWHNVVISTVPSWQEGPRFNSRVQRAFLCGVCLFSLCLWGFLQVLWFLPTIKNGFQRLISSQCSWETHWWRSGSAPQALHSSYPLLRFTFHGAPACIRERQSILFFSYHAVQFSILAVTIKLSSLTPCPQVRADFQKHFFFSLQQ